MSFQFNHKEYGSLIGSGTYQFRHYGDETPTSLILYDSGNEYTSVTGGWQTIYVPGQENKATLTKNSDSLYAYWGGSYNIWGGGFHTLSSISFSKPNAKLYIDYAVPIRFNYSTYKYGYTFSLTNDISSWDTTFGETATYTWSDTQTGGVPVARTTISFDWVDNQYVAFQEGGAQIYVYKIWLE